MDPRFTPESSAVRSSRSRGGCSLDRGELLARTSIRTNVAFAAMTMNKDWGISAYMYGWGAASSSSAMPVRSASTWFWSVAARAAGSPAIMITGHHFRVDGRYPPDRSASSAALSARRGRGRVLPRHHLLSQHLVIRLCIRAAWISTLFIAVPSPTRPSRSFRAQFWRWRASGVCMGGRGFSSSEAFPAVLLAFVVLRRSRTGGHAAGSARTSARGRSELQAERTRVRRRLAADVCGRSRQARTEAFYDLLHERHRQLRHHFFLPQIVKGFGHSTRDRL